MNKLAIGIMVVCSLMVTSGAAWCGNNGNGTLTVNGLVWLKDAGCLGYMKWDSAMSRPKSLAHGQCGLTDNSKIGDWRLPTVDELKAISAYKGQFKNVQINYYWSSSTCTRKTFAWRVYMGTGDVDYDSKDFNNYVWPVRAGQ